MSYLIRINPDLSGPAKEYIERRKDINIRAFFESSKYDKNWIYGLDMNSYFHALPRNEYCTATGMGDIQHMSSLYKNVLLISSFPSNEWIKRSMRDHEINTVLENNVLYAVCKDGKHKLTGMNREELKTFLGY